MHDDVGVLSVLGEEVGAVVIAAYDGDVGVVCGEGVWDAPEEDGDVVFWVGGGYGVEDGAADVACAAGAGGC